MFACVLYSPPAYICKYIALRFHICILFGRALVGKLYEKRGATAAAGPRGVAIFEIRPLCSKPRLRFHFYFSSFVFVPGNNRLPRSVTPGDHHLTRVSLYYIRQHRPIVGRVVYSVNCCILYLYNMIML